MKVGQRDYYPDPAELRRLMGEAMGSRATIEQFAELVGCSRNSVVRWEAGQCPPALMFRPRLLELERMLKEVKPIKQSLESKRSAPLIAKSVKIARREKMISLCFGVGGKEVEVLVSMKALVDAATGR